MSRLGKCTNYSGCLLAYRGEETNIPEGQAFVCAECGKALTEVKPGAKGLLLYGGIGVAVLAIAAGAVFGLKAMKAKQPATAVEIVPTTTPPSGDAPAATPVPPPDPGYSGGKGRMKMEATESPTEPNPASKGEAEPPPQVVAETKVNLTIDPSVKAEVLKRVDLMPGIPASDKDKLYNSVERARQMGRVITIPFGKGNAALNPGDVLALKDAFAMPEITKLLSDPLAALVILGYADPKGDPKANLKYSKDRAEAVANVIKKEFGDRNLVRSVAMGGSTLLDGQSMEKNRIAEVWVVLP